MRTRSGGVLEGVLTGVVAVGVVGAIGYSALTGNCVSCIFTGAGSGTPTVSALTPVEAAADATGAASSFSEKPATCGGGIVAGETLATAAPSNAAEAAPKACPFSGSKPAGADATVTLVGADEGGKTPACCALGGETLAAESGDSKPAPAADADEG